MTDTATRLRSAFKSAGFNARAISVASPHGNIRVTVRTALAPLAWVRAVAMQVQHVRHCEASGEILSGGNTFVDVEHHETVRAMLVNRYLEAVRVALAELQALGEGTNTLVPVAGATKPDGEPVYLGMHNGSVNVWDGSWRSIMHHVSDDDGIAYRIACNDPDQSVAMLPSLTVA